MNYSEREIANALNFLSKKYPDGQVNNNKVIGAAGVRLVIKDDSFIRQSMKHSNFKNIEYERCKFQNVAMAGSSIRSVTFNHTTLKGNGFTSCDFYGTEFIGENIYEANNFSQSNFTSCLICEAEFVSSGLIQTLFHKCKFIKSRFRSSTLEGSRFIGCEISDTDIGNANVEYIDLLNTKLERVIFPFYQFPYIIGAADYISDLFSTVSLRAGEVEVPMQEYVEQLDNLLLYFWDKSEYFPMCNLHIAMEDYAAAKECMLDGVNIALHDLDFRMIRHFCRLAQRHSLLDEVTTRRILGTIEEFMVGKHIPAGRLNLCLIHLGEIRGILFSGSKDSVSMRVNIRTNVQKEDEHGMGYVNSLSNELISALSDYGYGHEGFQVSVSNHSPYEIIVEVLSVAAELATIAGLIWSVIDSRKHKTPEKPKKVKTPLDSVMVDTDTYRSYVNSRIELYKEQLLNIKSRYSKQKMNNYIEEITQQLQTDLDALYDNDIMIFKVKNNPKNK